MKGTISKKIRHDFPALERLRNDKPPVYLDNACTTLVPRQVINAIVEYYRGFPACAGNRSRHWFAHEVNDRVEGNPEKDIKGSRRIIQDFINARSPKEIIFTQNASHAINMVALGYQFDPGDAVLLTDKEHNSNLIPWLRLQKAGVIQVRLINQPKQDYFDLQEFEENLKKNRVRLVSLAYTSNISGFTLPARDIIRIAHNYGARVLLDAAQTASHQTIDVQDLDVDFLVFSMHKMCGPKGVGILYGKQELLGSEGNEQNEPGRGIRPVLLGGGTIRDANNSSYILSDPPERFEVGTQNYAGQIAAGTAVLYLQEIGMQDIYQHTNLLNKYITSQLLQRYGDTGWFHIIGPQDATLRGPLLTFEIKRPNAVGIAEELSEKSNVMIRDGALCAHAYLNQKYGQDWIKPQLPSEHRMIYRASLYFYNSVEDCQVFLEALDKILKERSYI